MPIKLLVKQNAQDTNPTELTGTVALTSAEATEYSNRAKISVSAQKRLSVAAELIPGDVLTAIHQRQLQSNYIYKINNMLPGSDGTFFITGDACTHIVNDWQDSAITQEERQQQGLENTIGIVDQCPSCQGNCSYAWQLMYRLQLLYALLSGHIDNQLYTSTEIVSDDILPTPNRRQKQHDYNKGAFALTGQGESQKLLVCTQAGTTGDDDGLPASATTIWTDGSCKWRVTDSWADGSWQYLLSKFSSTPDEQDTTKPEYAADRPEIENCPAIVPVNRDILLKEPLKLFFQYQALVTLWNYLVHKGSHIVDIQQSTTQPSGLDIVWKYRQPKCDVPKRTLYITIQLNRGQIQKEFAPAPATSDNFTNQNFIFIIHNLKAIRKQDTIGQDTATSSIINTMTYNENNGQYSWQQNGQDEQFEQPPAPHDQHSGPGISLKFIFEGQNTAPCTYLVKFTIVPYISAVFEQTASYINRSTAADIIKQTQLMSERHCFPPEIASLKNYWQIYTTLQQEQQEQAVYNQTWAASTNYAHPVQTLPASVSSYVSGGIQWDASGAYVWNVFRNPQYDPSERKHPQDFGSDPGYEWDHAKARAWPVSNRLLFWDSAHSALIEYRKS